MVMNPYINSPKSFFPVVNPLIVNSILTNDSTNLSSKYYSSGCLPVVQYPLNKRVYIRKNNE